LILRAYLTDRNLQLFETLFREMFKPLSGFAMKYVRDWDEAKDLVHEVFVTTWTKFETLPSDTHYKSYLYTAVRNRCLNFIRDQKKFVDLEQLPDERGAENNTQLEAAELEKEIELGILSLPEKCRIIFEMNRRDGLKYSQIAEKLGISLKTVEAQMSKALNMLRIHLHEFLSVLLFIFL
jgi:RNA polymerase sigma-70 factor, ECF subfamily